jgi:hypothetical protein
VTGVSPATELEMTSLLFSSIVLCPPLTQSGQPDPNLTPSGPGGCLCSTAREYPDGTPYGAQPAYATHPPAGATTQDHSILISLRQVSTIRGPQNATAWRAASTQPKREAFSQPPRPPRRPRRPPPHPPRQPETCTFSTRAGAALTFGASTAP